MNAKEEFLKLVKPLSVRCAKITHGNKYYDDEVKTLLLKFNYTSKEYANFLHGLDFNYDNGFGGQELFGTIWFDDGTWAERAEYDGSEWWVHRELPEIPDELL